MTELLLIGIGTGNPDHLTGEGRRAIAEADLILIPRKGPGKGDLADLRRRIIDDVRGDHPASITEFDMPVRDPNLPYFDAVDAWHDAIAQAWTEAMAASPRARHVALLVWGDPSLYDSTLRVAARLDPRPAVRVIPGITALQALTAAHGIPLNKIGGPVTITTGRRLRDHGWPADTETLAVMLDGGCTFMTLPPEDFDIWWGAYLGMAEQILCSGALADIGENIVDKRARARAEHGWIMDTYLLRRR